MACILRAGQNKSASGSQIGANTRDTDMWACVSCVEECAMHADTDATG